MAKKRRFHPCGCLRGEDCTAKVQAGPRQAEQDDEMMMNELDVDVMEVNDVEESIENTSPDPVTNADPVTSL